MIPRFVDRASQQVEDAATSIPGHVRNLFSADGPLGALQFWRENKDQIEEATSTLLDTGEAAVRGDSDSFRRNAARLDFRWLRPRPAGPIEPLVDDGGISGARRARFNLERQVRNLILFALDSLTPWDYDRHDFGLTFAHTWVDIDANAGRVDAPPAVVKLTSTIKPLEKEWKLSARSKLMELPEGAVVFGKAGLYLAGDRPAYIGAEADRVWKVPRLKGTKVFVNVNYRSSRKPDVDPISTSVGVQQDFEVWKGVQVTLRIGTNPLEMEKIFVTPVPNGSYF